MPSMRFTLALLLCSALSCSKREAPNIAPDPSAATPKLAPSASVTAPPIQCAPTRSVQVDLDEWQKQLLVAKTETERNAALDLLRLRPVDDSIHVDEKGVATTKPLTPPQVAIQSLALSKDKRDGRIVTVRYSREQGDTSAEAIRVQVLRNLGKNVWCALAENELSVDQLATERACIGAPEGAPALAVEPVSLTHEHPKSLRVLTQTGLCAACGRSGEVHVAYYDATGTKLTKLFEHTLYSASYNGCPWPPVREDVGSVEIVGKSYPREIIAVDSTICTPPMADLPKEYREDCKPESETRRLKLQGDKYVEVSKTTSPKVPDAILAIEDSQFEDRTGGVGWGNRCLAHVKQGRWANARAACEHGLALKPTPAVQAALHYNLALVEEGLEHDELACEELQRSLVLRPGNASVEKKLEALHCQASD